MLINTTTTTSYFKYSISEFRVIYEATYTSSKEEQHVAAKFPRCM